MTVSAHPVMRHSLRPWATLGKLIYIVFRKRDDPAPAGLLQNQLLAESARLNGQFSIARKASRNCPTQGPRGCKHRKKKTC